MTKEDDTAENAELKLAEASNRYQIAMAAAEWVFKVAKQAAEAEYNTAYNNYKDATKLSD